MDYLDKKLLSELQEGLPFQVKPFVAVGKKLDIKESDVISRVIALKNAKIIRQISPIFDTRKLGYDSTLVAAKVDPGKITQIAEIINKHPGVSHNYERNHEFNLWFTLAVPPSCDLKSHLLALKRLTRVKSMRMLPALKIFKIGVKFELNGNEEEFKERSSSSPFSKGGLRRLIVSKDIIHPNPPLEKEGIVDNDKRAINILQDDLEITPHPFKKAAKKLGIAEDDVIAILTRFQENGIMRRFAAVLYHRAAGFSYNPMITWIVQPDKIDAAGKIMAGFKEVTHCYERPVYPDWPYSIFTMIHGRNREDCERVAGDISSAVEAREYGLLYSTREFKKTRLRYFDNSIELWEQTANKQKQTI